MHKPVLLKEVIEYLSPKPNENFVDCTLGGGGQALQILEMIRPNGKLLGIDLSREAIGEIAKIKNISPRLAPKVHPPRAETRLGREKPNIKERLILINDNFANLKKIVKKNNFLPVNGILLDLGLSSDLLEKSGKGFSFQRDEFLDMRFGDQGITAYEIINQYPKKELERIFKEYGEEKLSQPIVKNILKKRCQKKIQTTKDLVEIVSEVLEKFSARGGSAFGGKVYRLKLKVKTLARVFQAIRITVNNELENLKKVLKEGTALLASGGRIGVISYHSLEDRLVKRFFREQKKEGVLKIMTKKPVTPTYEEIKNNPRARSAKFRLAQKIV